MDEPIIHHGEIKAINGHQVTLAIRDTAPAGCGGCRLSDLCSRADNEGAVTITVDRTTGLSVGQSVRATVSERSQGLAIVWSLVIPLVIITGVVLPLAASDVPKWGAVGIAVGAVAIYDLLLWRFGPRISRSLKWTLLTDRA